MRSAKRRFVLFLALALLGLLRFGALSSAPAEGAGPRLVLSGQQLLLPRGRFAWLKAWAADLPAGERVLRYNWSSQDEAVATVDEGGKVAALGSGQTQIVCEAETGAGTRLRAECALTVVVPVVSLTPKEPRLTLVPGETAPFPELIVEPADAGCQTVTWASDRPEILRVTEEGITALAPGTVRLRAVSNEEPTPGYFTKTASVTISVVPALVSIRPFAEEYWLEPGQEMRISLTLEPAEAADTLLRWSSSDEAVVSVIREGWIRTEAVGDCTLTVMPAAAREGAPSCEIRVHVLRKIQQLFYATKHLYCFQGEIRSVRPEIRPADATNQVLEWSCDNPYVAALTDGGGTVLGRQVGVARLLCRTTDGTDRVSQVRLMVEPQVPLFILSGSWQPSGVQLRVKSRTREIPFRALSFRASWLDAAGKMLAEEDCTVSMLYIQPSRKADVVLPAMDPPEGAVSLRLRLAAVRTNDRIYEIADATVRDEDTVIPLLP